MKTLLTATFGLALVCSTIAATSFVTADPAEAYGGWCYWYSSYSC